MSRLPALRPRELIAALRKADFIESHQSGSHLVMKHADGRRAVIPIHAPDLKRSLMFGILKSICMTEDQLERLL